MEAIPGHGKATRQLVSSLRVSSSKKIAVLPGDGIGGEVIPQAVKVMLASGASRLALGLALSGSIRAPSRPLRLRGEPDLVCVTNNDYTDVRAGDGRVGEDRALRHGDVERLPGAAG